jgi:hypothetical protein
VIFFIANTCINIFLVNNNIMFILFSRKKEDKKNSATSYNNNVYIGNGWSWMSHKQFTHNTIGCVPNKIWELLTFLMHSFCVLCRMLSVDCAFLISSSVFSHVYLPKTMRLCDLSGYTFVKQVTGNRYICEARDWEIAAIL